MTDHYDALETRDPAAREAALFARLPEVLRKAMAAPAYANLLRGTDPASITSREALAGLPVLRKSELPALHKAAPPFGGFVADKPGSFARLFTSPGPIFEPEGRQADPWRGARALFAAGFREGDVVLNEINTMPGFTPFSMYPYMWNVTGMDYPTLIGELIDLALERPDDVNR